LPVVPEVYISIHGSAGLVLAGPRDQVLVSREAGRAGRGPEPHHAGVRHRQVGADLLDRAGELVLQDEGRHLGILQDVAHLLPDQPEVDRHRDEAGLRHRGVDLQPLDAIVGQHRHPLALAQAEAQERVGEPAGAGVPLPERHRAFEVARADPVGLQARLDGEHLPWREHFPHRGRPRLVFLCLMSSALSTDVPPTRSSWGRAAEPGIHNR
jgi:hypothetical protein